MGRLTEDELTDGASYNDTRDEVEISSTDFGALKLAVINSITHALECQAQGWKGEFNFAGERGVDFYEEVVKFEIELIKCALTLTGSNQRAAARLLGMKPTTLYSKVKAYKLGVDSKVARSA